MLQIVSLGFSLHHLSPTCTSISKTICPCASQVALVMCRVDCQWTRVESLNHFPLAFPITAVSLLSRMSFHQRCLQVPRTATSLHTTVGRTWTPNTGCCILKAPWDQGSTIAATPKRSEAPRKSPVKWIYFKKPLRIVCSFTVTQSQNDTNGNVQQKFRNSFSQFPYEKKKK